MTINESESKNNLIVRHIFGRRGYWGMGLQDSCRIVQEELAIGSLAIGWGKLVRGKVVLAPPIPLLFLPSATPRAVPAGLIRWQCHRLSGGRVYGID